MKKLFAHAFLVFCLLFFFNSAKAGSPFNDVSGDDPNWGWAYPYIVAMQQNNITSGCGGGNYCPQGIVTRGQAATFIVKIVEGDPKNYSQTPYFSDVPQNHWAFKYVQRVKELNIMQGYPNGMFGVEDPITRAQMAVIIVKGMAAKNLTTLPPINYCEGQAPPFSDVNNSYWACPYIKKLKELGVAGYGDGGYHPADYVNRAQMAAFIGSFFLGLSTNVKNPIQGFEYVGNTIHGIGMIVDSMKVFNGSIPSSVASVIKQSNNTLILKNFGSVSGQKMQSNLSKAFSNLNSANSNLASTQTIPCNSGSGILNQVDPDHFTVQFNQCTLESSTGYSVFNGQVSVSQSGNNYTISYGYNNVPLNIKSYSSGVLNGELNIALAIQMNNVNLTTNGFTTNIATNGYIEENDAWMYAKLSYNNFLLNLDYTNTATSTSLLATVNGNASIIADLKGQSLGNLTLNESYNNLKLTISLDSQFEQFSINGGLTASVVPTNLCSSGTYNFQTITPIKIDMFSDRYVDGLININNATITFNSDGTATVNSNGQSFTYKDPGNIPGICSF
jgi:hypothetical protein